MRQANIPVGVARRASIWDCWESISRFSSSATLIRASSLSQRETPFLTTRLWCMMPDNSFVIIEFDLVEGPGVASATPYMDVECNEISSLSLPKPEISLIKSFAAFFNLPIMSSNGASNLTHITISLRRSFLHIKPHYYVTKAKLGEVFLTMRTWLQSLTFF